MDHRAGHPVLHRKFPGWYRPRQSGEDVPSPLGILSRDTAFSRFPQQAQVPLDDPETRNPVQIHHDLQILCQVGGNQTEDDQELIIWIITLTQLGGTISPVKISKILTGKV